MDARAVDTTVTSGSSNLITSGAVYTAINVASSKLEGYIYLGEIRAVSSQKYDTYYRYVEPGYSPSFSGSVREISGPVSIECRTAAEQYKNWQEDNTYSGITKSFHNMEFDSISSNLRGSGTIKLEFIGGEVTKSYGFYVRGRGNPECVISVIDGSISDISFNFNALNGAYEDSYKYLKYYPSIVNITYN